MLHESIQEIITQYSWSTVYFKPCTAISSYTTSDSNRESRPRIISAYVSTSIAFIIFICILFYHAIQRLLSLKTISKMRECTCRRNTKKESAKNMDVNHSTMKLKVTHTSVELSELLLTDETTSTWEKSACNRRLQADFHWFDCVVLLS